jgi:hypothetical protein
MRSSGADSAPYETVKKMLLGVCNTSSFKKGNLLAMALDAGAQIQAIRMLD